MLYEIHMLKNYPSTNLNRDDTGTPKTCVFGGVARGRISSQCLKHSWRTFPVFKELVGASNLVFVPESCQAWLPGRSWLGIMKKSSFNRFYPP